jgi:hypothetical protein
MPHRAPATSQSARLDEPLGEDGALRAPETGPFLLTTLSIFTQYLE